MEPIVARQNFKKSLILVGLVSLIIGLALGASGGFYYLKSRLGNLVPALTGQPNVNYQISQETIDKLTSLEPGKIYNGKVGKKDSSGIVLDIWLFNPVNPALNQAVPVQIPFNAGVDKIFRSAILKTGATTTPASYNDINVGDYLTVFIFEDHKEFDITSAK